MLIRTAERNDITQILDLYEQLDEQMSQYQPDYIQKVRREEKLMEAILICPETDFLIAVEQDKYLGFVLISEVSTPNFPCFKKVKYANIMDIVCDQAVRGQGIGTALMDAAEQWARQRNLSMLQLNVLAQNESSYHLYKQKGFTDYSKTLRKKI